MIPKLEKILLINPSVTILSDSLKRTTTPLGLLYLGSVLKKRGYEVAVINSPCDGYENVEEHENGTVTYGLSDTEIEKRIANFDPDLIGVGNLFTAQRKNSLHHCDLAKKVKDVPVVIGGIDTTLAPEKSMEHRAVDFGILGEGEYRFLKLIQNIEKGEKEPNFDGVAYKKGKETKIILPTTRIKNLDELGIPDRSLVDMEKYFDIGVFYSPFPRGERPERIMVSRGCPFKCVFCGYHTGQQLIFRGLNNIFEEIDELVDKYKVDELQFSDDNLTINRKKAMDLFERLEPYKLKWCTPNGILVKSLDKEMIEAMAKSGAYQLTFNIESGSQRVVKEIIQGKEVPQLEDVKELVKICHDNGIQVHGQLMIGLPGETIEEVYQTLEYPFKADFDSNSFFIANPVPGSRLYRICKEKGYLKPESEIKTDFKSSDIEIPRDDPNFVMTSKEMEELVERKKREFNEYRKYKDPKGWEKAYKRFAETHDEDFIGRVT